SSGLALEARDLVASFPSAGGGRQRVFELPAMTLAPGARLGLTGPSGSGKSTLLLCLAGILPPERGRIAWGGVELTALPQGARAGWRRRNLGMVSQDFHLIDGLAALDNVLLPLRFERWRATAALAERGRALLDRLGVPAAQRVERLSRGQMQRVALARAVLQR